jgi:hypothetical protein
VQPGRAWCGGGRQPGSPHLSSRASWLRALAAASREEVARGGGRLGGGGSLRRLARGRERFGVGATASWNLGLVFRSGLDLGVGS